MKVRASLSFLLLLAAVTLVSGCQKDQAKQPTAQAKTQSQKAAPANKAGSTTPAKAKAAGVKPQATSSTNKTKNVAAVVPKAPKIEAPKPTAAKSTQFKIVHSSNLQGEVEPCG